MKANRGEAEHALAVFIDFENLAMGFNGRTGRFEIGRVLERLVEKGKIVVKKAYCDWSRFGNYTGPLHEAAIELIEIPKRSATGKNSADIRLVVDAIDLAYSKDHIDTFCIVSGDSDFSPLVSKLKELGKHVIGLGLANATSELLRDNCDEFIYYEDLGKQPIVPTNVTESMPEQKKKMFTLLMESLIALRRENKELIYSSMVKDTMKRKKPSFNEGYYGYNTFSELLEDAQKQGLLDLEKSKSSGTYVVVRFGNEPKMLLKAERAASEGRGSRGDRGERRERGRRGEGRSSTRAKVALPVEDNEPLEDVPSYGAAIRKPATPPVAPATPVPQQAPLVPTPPPTVPRPAPTRSRTNERTIERPVEQPVLPPPPPRPRPMNDGGFGAGLDLD
jgi:uncharacterized protein (TIGR00288 family)